MRFLKLNVILQKLNHTQPSKFDLMRPYKTYHICYFLLRKTNKFRPDSILAFFLGITANGFCENFTDRIKFRMKNFHEKKTIPWNFSMGGKFYSACRKINGGSFMAFVLFQFFMVFNNVIMQTETYRNSSKFTKLCTTENFRSGYSENGKGIP